MWDYQAFLGKLEDNFIPHNPVGNAEKSLHELNMKKTAHIVKYNVDFWQTPNQLWAALSLFKLELELGLMCPSDWHNL